MRLYSTNNRNLVVSLEQAIFKSLPIDNGLYLPTVIPSLPAKFFQDIHHYSLAEIAFIVAKTLIGDEIPDSALKKIIEQAITFTAPLINLYDNVYVLELFHGPSNAFKDFGACFMASLVSYYLKRKDSAKINILVATSGDTGSAVAHGFSNIENVQVTILYPSGMVSEIQEKQLTTLGGNVAALEVDGTFDDCQRMVKEAFLDTGLQNKLTLTSANSINIARLIPQSFYYFHAYACLNNSKPAIFSVPSGNLGNLCAGVIAKKMGLNIAKFVASTNINNVLPEYLASGVFMPKRSVQTIANAMDVGHPSNFARLNSLYKHDVAMMRKDIVGKSYTDDETRAVIRQIDNTYSYTLDPHSAIGYMGLRDFLKAGENKDVNAVFLATASPSKFYQEIEAILGRKIALSESLKLALSKPKHSIKIAANLSSLKEFLLQRSS